VKNGVLLSIGNALDTELYTDLPNYFKWMGEVLGYFRGGVLSVASLGTAVEPFSKAQLTKVIPSMLQKIDDSAPKDIVTWDAAKTWINSQK